MENVRKHRVIKLAPTEKRKNYFVSDPNYHKTIFFWKTINNRNEKNTYTYE